jgi:hypothetical protein
MKRNSAEVTMQFTKKLKKHDKEEIGAGTALTLNGKHININGH